MNCVGFCDWSCWNWLYNWDGLEISIESMEELLPSRREARELLPLDEALLPSRREARELPPLDEVLLDCVESSKLRSVDDRLLPTLLIDIMHLACERMQSQLLLS